MSVSSIDRLDAYQIDACLLRISDLSNWVKKRGVPIPMPTGLNPLEGGEFISLGGLLSLIGAATGENSVAAEAHAKNALVVHRHLAAHPGAEGAARWLAADLACKQWRTAILEAVNAGAFDLLDPASKMPIRYLAEHAAPSRPISTHSMQEAAILEAIKKRGLDPKKLPRTEPGKAGIKASIRDDFFHPATPYSKTRRSKSNLFVSVYVFDRAWERLRAQGEIGES